MDARAAGPILGRSSLFVDVFDGHYVKYFAGGDLFLSHCHTDHMQGLSSDFRSAKVHCSEISARLLSLKFGSTSNLMQVVRPHAIGESFDIWDLRSQCVITVTLLNSNHCPGAVMLAFEGWPEGHTGDCRFHNGMREDPVLCRLAGGSVRCQMLHLDTTCAHESLANLPSQEASINMLLDLLDRHASENVFLHSHGLGDEALLDAVARYLPSGCKLLFADAQRYAKIMVTDPGFGARFCALITHGVPLPIGRLVIVVPNSPTRNAAALRNVPGIQVSCSTLWWAKRAQDDPDASTGDCALPLLDKYGVWHILWSMHSSLVEQQALVSLMRPLQVRPICKSLMDGHQAVSRTLADISRFIAELCGLPVVELGDLPEILDAPMSPESPQSPPSPGKSALETAKRIR